jgi:hypothetical protein
VSTLRKDQAGGDKGKKGIFRRYWIVTVRPHRIASYGHLVFIADIDQHTPKV